MPNQIVHYVEDDKVTQKFFARDLRALGFTVVSHDNAEAFLSYLGEHSNALETASCVITDYNMGVMNGAELTQKLRSRDGAVIIIGTSGIDQKEIFSGKETLNLFMNNGATDAITKDYLKQHWREVLERNGVIMPIEKPLAVLPSQTEAPREMTPPVVRKIKPLAKQGNPKWLGCILSRKENRVVGEEVTVDRTMEETVHLVPGIEKSPPPTQVSRIDSAAGEFPVLTRLQQMVHYMPFMRGMANLNG